VARPGSGTHGGGIEGSRSGEIGHTEGEVAQAVGLSRLTVRLSAHW
jgi:hypothetical protein